MPLKINLYHEVLRARREEQYDPLRLSMMGLIILVVLMAGYYAFALAGKSSVESGYRAKQAEYNTLLPQANTAKREEEELNKTFELADRLTKRIEERFYWGPLFEQLVAVVPAHVQLTRCTGEISQDSRRRVQMSIEGVAAGDEPRAVAEEMRVALVERLSAKYKNVTATFKNLEESSERVTLEGKQLRTANFSIAVQFQLASAPEPTPAPVKTVKKDIAKQDNF